jgi:lipopolysaccharide export system protein LptA
MSRRDRFRRILATVFGAHFLYLAPDLAAFNQKEPFDVSADMINYAEKNQEITAEGHVKVEQSSASLTADYIQLDRVQQRLVARGNVILREKGSILAGEVLDYDLRAERGTMQNGKGYASPWLFQGDSWDRQRDYYVGRNASFTSCDLIDPHFHMRSVRVHVVPDRRFWAWGNKVYADTVPAFYSPFLYKDLSKRRVVFQVQPGHDTVNGSFAKTVTTVRFTDHIYDRVLFDHYSAAGNGVGNEFNYKDKDRIKGSLFGYYINPKGTPELVGAPKAPQYNIRSYHWQRVRDDLTMQSNVNLRKNVSFNNRFFQQDINQSVNDITSSIALTQQKRRFNHRLVFERYDAPDPGDDSLFAETHVQTASLPRYDLTFFQTPLWTPKTPEVSSTTPPSPNQPKLGPLQFSASVTAGETYSRVDDRTRTNASAGFTLSESIPLSRNWSYSPTITPEVRWQDKEAPLAPTTSTTTVIQSGSFKGAQGRFGTTHTLRYRPLSSLTIDQSYALTERFMPNKFEADRRLADRGIETHRLNWLLYWRPQRQVLFRSFSGFDMRKIDDEPLNNYRQRRFDPWTAELTFQPQKIAMDYFFRHQLSYYPTRTSLWEASARYSGIYRTIIETGLLYNRGAGGVLTSNSRLGFYLSPGWRVDAVVHALVPNGSLGQARNARMIDNEFIVIRDLHCWEAQFSYRNRPPFSREYSLMLNLKLGAKAAREIADQDLEAQFYPWRAGNYAR